MEICCDSKSTHLENRIESLKEQNRNLQAELNMYKRHLKVLQDDYITALQQASETISGKI